MRTIFWIFLIGLLLYLAYRYIKKSIDKLTFSDPTFAGVDLLAIVNKTGFSSVNVSTTITNKNNFNIPVNGLYLEVSHNGSLVGKSTVPTDSIIIPRNGEITVTQNITLSLDSAIGIGAKLIAKQPIIFDYFIKATLFNFYPFTYRSSFTYTR